MKFQAALSCNTFINDLLDDSLSFTAQDESKVVLAPSLKKDQGHINFKDEKFKEIKNKVRAFKPWPSTRRIMRKKRRKVIEVETSDVSLRPGETTISINHLLVGCQDATVRLAFVQLEGKKACKDTELINGLKNKKVDNIEIN